MQKWQYLKKLRDGRPLDAVTRAGSPEKAKQSCPLETQNFSEFVRLHARQIRLVSALLGLFI